MNSYAICEGCHSLCTDCLCDLKAYCDLCDYNGFDVFTLEGNITIYLCYTCWSKAANFNGRVGSGHTWREILDHNEMIESSYSSGNNKKKKISSRLRQKVLTRDKYRCRYCGSYENLCCDHVVPESKGGGTNENNLVAACQSCNSKKGAKMLEDTALVLSSLETHCESFA